jgi:putative SOS response-associated peptidase YedK
MCGRMTLTRSPQEIAAFFELEPALATLAGPDGRPLEPRYNIAPSQAVLTVGPDAAGRRAFAWKTWGLVPAWAGDPAIGGRLFNARAETVETKPSFRSAFKRRRCLVVADGFYEWNARSRGHRPFWLHPREGALLAFAGLFERWSLEQGPVIDSCTILTTEANSDLSAIHHRMPIVLPRTDWSAWLEPTTRVDALKALLVAAPAGTLEAREVSRFVNTPQNDDPRCLEAAAAPAPEQGIFRLDGGG